MFGFKPIVGIAFLLTAAGTVNSIQSASAQEASCSSSARLLRYACTFDARDDLYTAIARCEDATVPDGQCVAEAESEFDEARDECGEILGARLEVCDALDDAVHTPAFGEDFAETFVDPRTIGFGTIPNPFFPLVAGNTWVYEGDGETVTVVVTSAIKRIGGIDCVVVNDVVEDEDGFVIEDTDDWYAQDVDGNVWYCGEIAENFEFFEGDEPELVELVDIDGSWKHGRERAKAGLLMPIEPVVGDVIRQEVDYTNAEDVIEILSVTATETSPGGACAGDCLQTRDFTPLEPDTEEHKFYAPGVGLIVELDTESGDRLELISFVGVGS